MYERDYSFTEKINIHFLKEKLLKDLDQPIDLKLISTRVLYTEHHVFQKKYAEYFGLVKSRQLFCLDRHTQAIEDWPFFLVEFAEKVNKTVTLADLLWITKRQVNGMIYSALEGITTEEIPGPYAEDQMIGILIYIKILHLYLKPYVNLELSDLVTRNQELDIFEQALGVHLNYLITDNFEYAQEKGNFDAEHYKIRIIEFEEIEKTARFLQWVKKERLRWL
jgi:hypothetical protein